MEKLIKLLSEYTHIDFVKHEDGCFKEKYMGEEGRWKCDTEIINKEYGFIKWLVDNDKIDYENIKNIKLPLDTKLRAKVDEDEKTCLNRLYTLKLLMLLAISDTPIEDLISYLK